MLAKIAYFCLSSKFSHKKTSAGEGAEVFELERFVLLARQETGAILVDIGQLAVTQNLGVGVIDLEAAQQGYQGSLLRWGSRVGRAPMLV